MPHHCPRHHSSKLGLLSLAIAQVPQCIHLVMTTTITTLFCNASATIVPVTLVLVTFSCAFPLFAFALVVAIMLALLSIVNVNGILVNVPIEPEALLVHREALT